MLCSGTVLSTHPVYNGLCLLTPNPMPSAVSSPHWQPHVCPPFLCVCVSSRHTLRVGHRFPLQAPEGCNQSPWGPCEWKRPWSRALLLKQRCLLSASWPACPEAGFLEETLTQADLVSWGPHKCPDFTSFFPQTTCFSKKYKKNKSSRDGVRVEKIYSKKGKWKVKCCVVPASSCGSRCCQK